MLYDHYRRAKPYARVLRGFNPNEPHTFQRSLPVKTDVTIKSGHVIIPEWDATNLQWVWALANRADAAHLDQIPAIALQDSDDYDVRGAGQLSGLSCSGQFEIQSGYYVLTGVPAVTDGMALTYGSAGDAEAGLLKTVARGAGPTFPILGFLSGGHRAAVLSLAGKVSEASDLNVFQFRTHYDLGNAAS